jgi:hypothetical protein
MIHRSLMLNFVKFISRIPRVASTLSEVSNPWLKVSIPLGNEWLGNETLVVKVENTFYEPHVPLLPTARASHVRTRDRLQCCPPCLSHPRPAGQGRRLGEANTGVGEPAQPFPRQRSSLPSSPYLDLDGYSGPAKGCYLWCAWIVYSLRFVDSDPSMGQRFQIHKVAPGRMAATKSKWG